MFAKMNENENENENEEAMIFLVKLFVILFAISINRISSLFYLDVLIYLRVIIFSLFTDVNIINVYYNV
jgi:hypothetical protein